MLLPIGCRYPQEHRRLTGISVQYYLKTIECRCTKSIGVLLHQYTNERRSSCGLCRKRKLFLLIYKAKIFAVLFANVCTYFRAHLGGIRDTTETRELVLKNRSDLLR